MSLVETFKGAMLVWDGQKADGVPVVSRIEALSISLRLSWPGQTREWKYLCQHCSDYGLVMAECDGDATCGRDKRHLPHEFGTPCWCSNGNRFRGKPDPKPDDFASAGKTPKRQMTRFGR